MSTKPAAIPAHITVRRMGASMRDNVCSKKYTPCEQVIELIL